MAHRSWCAERPGHRSNERLEFLGDAVLGLIVTDHLYRTYPGLPEGQMAQVRASVVNAEVLAEVAEEIDLGSALCLGRGEDASGGREKPSILSDAMEAVIGAVYLDGGWDASAELVMRLLGERVTEGAAGPGGHDFKTRLQELSARVYDDLPRYRHASEGPDHAKRFSATVSVAGIPIGRGEGRSKKQAEQAAARMAWQRLASDGIPVALPEAGPASIALPEAGPASIALPEIETTGPASTEAPSGPPESPNAEEDDA
ncbi:MAG: ribonuclease III [Actinomycetota bacterium]|nr:ribonuclease III [Actinomycetota bacterium]